MCVYSTIPVGIIYADDAQQTYSCVWHFAANIHNNTKITIYTIYLNIYTHSEKLIYQFLMAYPYVKLLTAALMLLTYKYIIIEAYISLYAFLFDGYNTDDDDDSCGAAEQVDLIYCT